MSSVNLKLTESWEQDTELMEAQIRRLSSSGRTLQILEAGCGQAWPLGLGGVDYVLTGLDFDKDALEIRLNTSKDLHKAIVGDLRTAEFPEASFDVIFNSFVLEHVSGAEAVMKNFVKWLRPGGIILLRIPDPQSVHGFMTRVTPHWFHVLYYRYVLNQKKAGMPGHAPYPVHYDRVLWRDHFAGFCLTNNLTIISEYGDGYIQSGRGIAKVLIAAFKRCVNIISLGRLDHRHTNLLYILERK